MSLEATLEAHSAALQENTATLRDLLAAWNKLAANANKVTADQIAEKGLNAGGVPIVSPKPKAEASATKATPTPKAGPVAASQPPATAAASPASKPEDTSPAAPVTYDDVRALVVKVSRTKGEDVARAVLTGLGVAKAPALTPEQYPEAVAQLQAALA